MWSPSNRAVVLVVVLVSLSIIGMPLGAGAGPPDIATADFTTQAASFSITNLRAPASATTGSTIEVKATVKNTGNKKGTTDITYRFNGTTRSTKSVTVAAGDKKTVAFSFTIPDVNPGSYRHGVFIANTDSGETTNIQVDEPGPAFRVTSLTAPDRATAGEQVTIRAEISNVGTASGTTDVEYRIAGDTLASRTITLGAGKSTSVELTATIPKLDPGSYTQGVYVKGTDEKRTKTLTVEGDAAFRVSDLSAPSRAEVDERIRVEARITNTGTGPGSKDIQYRIGGNRIDTQRVELDAGASKRIVFSVRVPSMSTGNYTQGVFIGSTNQGQTSRLRITGSPSFEVSNLQAPARAAAGDQIRVSATIRNAGNANGQTSIEYRFDGDRLARETVRLNAREQTTVAFTVQVPNQRLGTYRHGIFVGTSNRGQTSSIEVQEAAPRFDISGLDAPAQIRIGDEATIRAQVTNTGTRAGSTTVEYRVGGRTLADDSVSLLPGESKTVTLRTRYPGFTAGTYTQGVFRVGTNQGPTSTLSLTGEANFEIANFQAPARVTTGDQIAVQATVINTGTAQGTTGIQYRVADQRRAAKQVSLQPGERTTVSFDVQIRNNPSTYSHGVFVGDTQRGQTSSLLVEGREPTFSVSNLRGPAQANIGDEITVEATVSNIGTGAGATDLQLRLDGNQLDTKRINLRPGQQEVVSFTIEVSDIAAGTHRYGVFIGDSDQGQTSSIRVVSGQPRYSVADLSGPAEVTAGDRITVEATILNTGTGEGSTTIEYRFAGETLASQSINLAASADTRLSFTATVPDVDAGTYRHGVFISDSNRGQTSSVVVGVPVQTEAPGLVGFGVLVGLVALLLVTLSLVHRQRDRQE